jgi:prepilin peptidase CpaA
MWTSPVGQNSPLQWGAVFGACVLAGATDLRWRRIPNWLTGPLFVTGLIFGGSVNLSGWARLGDSVGATLLLAAPFIVLFVIAGGGAGDAKMMGAIGAWLGVRSGGVVLLAVCLSGMVLGIGWAIVKGRSRGVFLNMFWMVMGLFYGALGRSRPSEVRSALPESRNMLLMPYGLAILVGVSVVALHDLLTKARI